MSQSSVDDLLKPISNCLQKHADEILDFRESALKRNNPGQCMMCYFKLFSVIKAEEKSKLFSMKRWIEQHLEVVAHDLHHQETIRIPIDLKEESSLEDFCHRAMDRIWNQRKSHDSQWELCFDWLDSELAA